MVENNCPKCNQKNKHRHWCQTCYSQYFQDEFPNWSSGNQIIDNFIQGIQLRGFGKVYSAVWPEGPKVRDEYNVEFFCREENHPVSLKTISHLGPTVEGFFSEINNFIDTMKCGDGFHRAMIRYYGMTQNPETKEYMMVTEFASQGTLRDSLTYAAIDNYSNCIQGI
ncbi:2254_t:CDS:2 [Entrophospora sp. SA101]|nr:2254_t:CDS:2 [Entrophospora sp. SA101]